MGDWEEWVNLSFTKKGFYDDGVWTRGEASLTGFRADVTSRRFIVIETWGWNPYRDDPEKLDLRISIAEQTLRPHHQEGFRYYFEIPLGLTEITSLEVHSTTFVPKEHGINNEERRLGIAFKSISFE